MFLNEFNELNGLQPRFLPVILLVGEFFMRIELGALRNF